jgi:hypothetical protein
VSAAEVLDRSRNALSAPSTGIEVLTYDLALEGVLGELLPVEQAGRFTVEEMIDHDHAGRYRLLKLAPDGRTVLGAADDPPRGTRTRYVRADGRGYLLRFSDVEKTALSVPDLKRFALQTFITLMQSSGGKTLSETVRNGEPCYVIDMPSGSVAGGAMLMLEGARAIVTVADARLVEFSAFGRIAERPFSIEFALQSRELRPAHTADSSVFDIPAGPDDVLLQAGGSANPLWDVVAGALSAIPPPAGAR